MCKTMSHFQVNNNVSYGGSNRVTNIAYSKNSGGASTSSEGGASGSGVYSKNADTSHKDRDVVVLLPQNKSRTPKINHKLAVSFFYPILQVRVLKIFDETFKGSRYTARFRGE